MVWLTYSLQRFGVLSTHVACVPVLRVADIRPQLLALVGSGVIAESSNSNNSLIIIIIGQDHIMYFKSKYRYRPFTKS